MQTDYDTSLQAIEVDYFDDLIAEAEQVEHVEQQAAVQRNLLPKDEWCKGFIVLHGMGATAMGIKSIALPNSRIDGGTAQEIAETFYDMILDVPFLHFLLKPGGEWLGRIMIVYVYAQGMRGAIGEELAERRKEKSPEAGKTKQKQVDIPDFDTKGE